jgi:hypothetical protein
VSSKDSYTSKEWQTLQFAPLWVFTAVAAADQKIDEKEVEALTKEIKDAPLYKEPLVREILISLAFDLVNVMEQYKRDSRDVMSGLRDVASVLDKKATPEEANHFKRALLLIGGNVAKASGGGGILRRDPMSAEEKTALVMVALSLGVSP